MLRTSRIKVTPPEPISPWEMTHGDKVSYNKQIIQRSINRQLQHGHRSDFFGIDPEAGFILSAGEEALNGNNPLITIRKKTEGTYIARIPEEAKNKASFIPKLVTQAIDSLNDTVMCTIASQRHNQNSTKA